MISINRGLVLLLLFTLLQIGLVTSYPYRTVLIISDPYIELSGLWSLSGPMFRLGARLFGFNTVLINLENKNNLNKVIEELGYVPEVTILSPWYDDLSDSRYLKDSKIIITGGNFTKELNDNTTAVIMDPAGARAKAGYMAGKIALKEQKPALFLHFGDNEAVLKAYEAVTGENLPIKDIQLSASSTSLPSGFNKETQDCSVLLLFAGPFNIDAFKATDTIQLPVITEFALTEEQWNSRLLASVEIKKWAMHLAVLTELSNEKSKFVKNYPGKLKRNKKLFDVINQLIL